MKYKVYAFDFDLTLADTTEISKETYRLAYAAVGADFTGEDVFHHLTRDLSATFKEIDDGIRDYDTFLRVFESESAKRFDMITLYPDVLETLERIKRGGAKTALITNRVAPAVESALKKYGGMKKLFDYTVTGDITKNFKPHPEPVLNCLKAAGVEKKDFVYIGDAYNDYLSAFAANVDFVYVDRHGKVDKTGAITSLSELFDPPHVCRG